MRLMPCVSCHTLATLPVEAAAKAMSGEDLHAIGTEVEIPFQKLMRDGFVILENVYTPQDLAAFREQFKAGWSPLKETIDSHGLEWKRRNFNDQLKTFHLGRALYEGKLVSTFEDTPVIDMGHGRYDFTHGLDQPPLSSPTLLSPAIVGKLMHRALRFGYAGYVGGLPVDPAQGDEKTHAVAAGYWHRDAYSFFEDEVFDLQVPPFYFTMLVPLDDISASDGPTEFVVGSHRFNFTENGVLSAEQVESWAETQPRATGTMPAGSACIFHGYTLHRGLANTSGACRHMIYAVFKKNWYSDEDPLDYTDSAL